MKLWPIVFIGKPFRTITEAKRDAGWGDGPPRYHITQPGPAHKLWKPVQSEKRKSA